MLHHRPPQRLLRRHSKVYGELDLADALDLDAAVTARAAHLKTLDPTTDAPERSEAATRRRPRRETVLHVHLSAAALTDPTSGAGVVGRLDSPGATDTLVTTEQIRRWCANPFARVVVKPVIDLDDHLHVASYEVPDRLAAQVTLRDRWCVFPWCTRPARVCDCDHAVPHAEGGSTCDCNLAPLCRRHHRLKTHATGWSYTVLDPGTYLWRSPHGYRFLRDHTGTRDVTDEPPPRPG